MDREELTNILVCIFALLLSTLVFLIIISNKLSHGRTKKLVPPGNMGFPCIGETWDFYRAQKKNRLFEDFIQPRTLKHGKIFKTHLMGSPTVIVNGSDANRFVLSNEFKTVISSWPSAAVQLMGRDSIMEKQGEQHRCLRGLISSTFGPVGLNALVPKISQSIRLHLGQHWDGEPDEDRIISLYRSAKTMSFTIVFECLLGIEVKPGVLETFERVLEGVFAPPIGFPGTKFSRAKKARKEIERLIVEVVREKKKVISSEGIMRGGKEEGMLLSRLVEGMVRKEITEKEVVDNVVLLVFAAHDTTSFAIAMTFKMLSQHPKCHALLLQEHVDLMKDKRPGETLTLDDIKKMTYSWQVARESMRLFPPIFGSFRKAIVDIDYQGFTIPKGWKVLWTAYGTHNNAEYFKDPMSFNPSRFDEPVPPYAFLPFGGGPRVCAGYQLAKLTILIFLHFVVTRYDWSLIHPDETITVDPLPFPTHGMPIKISPKTI